jgi:hypothetical protein
LPEPKVVKEHITLKGEIIDPKCYLGAMKPGGGKTHKARHACISGGVPPMLVTRDASKQETFYLLTTAEGGLAGELVLPFVGDSGRSHRTAGAAWGLAGTRSMQMGFTGAKLRGRWPRSAASALALPHTEAR